MKRYLCLAAVYALTTAKILAQGEVPVNMYTGTPQITVPIGSVSSHDISVPIYFSYDATGIRVKQPSGYYGLGWNLVAGGSITRQVRGIPDDQSSPRGWIYNDGQHAVMANDVNGLIPPSNDDNTCPVNDPSEPVAQSKIDSYYSSHTDTEPDIFNFAFPGYSGKFVFDNSPTPTIHLIPWQDVKITYTQGPNQTLTAFVITTNDGVTYTFDQVSTESRMTTEITNTQEVLERDYLSYHYSTNIYNTEWKLTNVSSPSGGKITLSYTANSTSSIDTVRASVRNAPVSSTYSIVNLYKDARTGSQLRLKSISGTSGNMATLDYTGTNGSVTAINFIDSRVKYSPVYKTFSLTYSTITSFNYIRTYLSTITESSGCDKKPPYKFTYINGSSDGSSLPPPWSKAVDFWGYANGIYTNSDLIPTVYVYPALPPEEKFRLVQLPSYSGTSYTLPGANRNPSATGMMAGTLSAIQFPTGGTTSITYEPNQYYDSQLGSSVMGGGIRIKAFTYFDGINSNAAITKFFNYTDGSGKSSGRLISRPMFAEPVLQYVNPANGVRSPPSDITYQIIRTDKDLSAGETTYGSAVGYTQVTVSRPNSGSAQYQYLVPGTYATGASGAWSPSVDGFARARNGCPLLLDIITTASPWQFPYAPNPDFDYERGLVSQLQEFDNNNHLVRKTVTDYQYIYNSGSAPYNVSGLRYEKFPNGSATDVTYLFSKYNLFTDVAKVKFHETVTTYDASDLTKHASNVTEYDYLSSAHHLLTQVKTTTSDGTIYYNETRYPKDYAANGTDMASQMIGNLQNNFRNGTAIEQVSSVQRPGDSRKYTGGSVITFSNFGGQIPLPQYAYKLNVQSPPTSFDYTYVDPGTLSFHKNSNYELSQTFTSFDGFGNPQTTIGQDQIPVTTAWGYSGTVPIVSSRNASFGQFAFSDFETSTGVEFTVGSGGTMGTGRTGAYALNALTANLTSKTLTKGASTYMFSLWLKNTAATTVNISVQNTAQTTTYTTVSKTWTPSGNTFQYFETPVSIDASLSSFVIVVSTSSSGSPLIDDVSFYPQGADLTTSTYSLPFGQNSVTANGNATKYTVYDGLGREKYLIDTYGNIREKVAYQYQGLPGPAFAGGFTYMALPANDDFQGGVVWGDNVFTAKNCVDGATYTWTVTYSGTGAPTTTPSPITSNTQIQVLTFPAPVASPGFYYANVSLTVTHPTYGSSTISVTVPVSFPILVATTCAAGAANVMACGSTATIVSTYSCPGIVAPSDPTGTTFVISGINLAPGETITGYQWQWSTAGEGLWKNKDTTTTYTVASVTSSSSSYDVQCQITTSLGRTVISNTVTVVIYCN